ncbi:MAG: F0F1 ATP synthase subunit epsilon [Ruminococcaceae bacterium]|nr:F0F1 ATP synthase subunit epsilon [Oscillospiraceae bacterium]
MNSFHLKIVTPDGVCYDGDAQSVTVRSITGDIGILARHIDITSPLGEGEARVMIDGETRRAHCSRGLLSVQNGEVTLLPAVFRWKE